MTVCEAQIRVTKHGWVIGNDDMDFTIILTSRIMIDKGLLAER